MSNFIDVKEDSAAVKSFKKYGLKTWGFKANQEERAELDRLVIASKMGRRQAVMYAMRKAFKGDKE